MTYLVLGTSLGDVLVSDLDLGLEQSLQQVAGVDSQKEGHFFGLCQQQQKAHIVIIITEISEAPLLSKALINKIIMEHT